MAKKLRQDLIAQIETLGKEGKGPTEIGKTLGISRGVVRSYLKKIGITRPRLTKKMDQAEFEKLWREGKSDEEIAKHFGVKLNTVKNFRTNKDNAGKFTLQRYFSQTEQKLSNKQEQMILGSLLGDMNISKSTKNGSKNARLAIVHSKKQMELFMNKVEVLDEFMGNYRLSIPKPDKRTGNVYETYRGNSKAHQVFTDMYDKLYINGVKTITQEYLDMITDPIALAYWFMDDGTECGQIATHCFTEQEVDLLIQWMNNRWHIKCTKQKQLNHFTVYVNTSTRLDFELLIFPYVIPSMHYKLKYLDILTAESV